MSSKPTVLLIPGGWHNASCFSLLESQLQALGYPTKALTLPSYNSATPKTQTVATDSAAIQKDALLPLLEEGKEVLIVMHSFGACPGSAAAKGFSKAEWTAKGKTGGTIGLVFIAPTLMDEGATVFDNLGGKWFPGIVVDDEAGVFTPEDPIAQLYGDVPADVAARAVKELGAQPISSLQSPSPPVAWRDASYSGRLGFLRTDQDKTMPPMVQDMMITQLGVEWSVKKFDTSHSPFLSQPEKVATALDEWVVEFQKLG